MMEPYNNVVGGDPLFNDPENFDFTLQAGSPAIGYGIMSGSSDIGEVVPEKVELNQNYPNPFNPETTIGFSLNGGTHVNLSIFNSKGELVSNLVNRELNSGSHSYIFDGSNLNSGVYYYRLTGEGFNESSRMVLVK